MSKLPADAVWPLSSLPSHGVDYPERLGTVVSVCVLFLYPGVDSCDMLLYDYNFTSLTCEKSAYSLIQS